MENIRFSECNYFASSSLIKQISELKNDNPLITIDYIAKMYGFSKPTIRKYLKIGTELGLCKYIPKKSIDSAKMVCELWENGYSRNEIQEITQLHKTSILKYLKFGSDNNWCHYNPREELSKNAKKNVMAAHAKTKKKVIDIENNRVYESISDAHRNTGYTISYISRYARKGNNLKWMFYDDYCKSYNDE
jgi:predicted DNA-binding transcriptional regulator AlpA